MLTIIGFLLLVPLVIVYSLVTAKASFRSIKYEPSLRMVRVAGALAFIGMAIIGIDRFVLS